MADAKDPAVKAALRAEDIKAWFARMPWRKGRSPVSAAPEYEDYLFEQWSHGIFDDFWKQPGIYAEGYYDRYADVPVVNLSGWYDPYARTAVDNYLGLSRNKRGPVRLILGPWTHGDRSLTYAGDVDFGPAAPVDGNLAEDFFALRRRWFDRWVKGVANGVDAEPRGARVCDGRRIGAAQRRRAARPWRALADGRRLAAAARPGGRNSTCMPTAASAASCRPRSAPAARLHLRSAPPGADDRRRAQLGRAGDARRRL